MCFVSYTTDPQCFVIGGGVSKAGQYLIDILKQHYEKYVRLQKPEAQIHLATLGNDAGIYGAARMALEE
jgi:glucokinase